MWGRKIEYDSPSSLNAIRMFRCEADWGAEVIRGKVRDLSNPPLLELGLDRLTDDIRVVKCRGVIKTLSSTNRIALEANSCTRDSNGCEGVHKALVGIGFE